MHTKPWLPVERCSIHCRETLYRDYISKPLPVVIPDAAQHWPALRRWSPEFFKARYASVKREIEDRSVCLGDYIDSMIDPAPGAALPYPYCFDLRKVFPEILADVQPQPRFAPVDRLHHPLLARSLLSGTVEQEIFFGGEGSVLSQLHFDVLYLHAHITQICGEKEFFLFPPEQAKYMYPRADNGKHSQLDMRDPDLERYPLFREAQPYHTVVKPGETIFFPGGWWHFTRLHGPNIAYGGAVLSRANWPAFIRDNHEQRLRFGGRRWKAAGLPVYGAVVGKLMDLQERCVEMLSAPADLRSGQTPAISSHASRAGSAGSRPA